MVELEKSTRKWKAKVTKLEAKMKSLEAEICKNPSIQNPVHYKLLLMLNPSIHFVVSFFLICQTFDVWVYEESVLL